ncbi:hypothetical protein V5799_027287 [Amblyomma americanum]|uniref:Uncharacterized protein n=1 Tax=Amblyomma americanum TaxID=6943 RepID=A0AAQ4DG53_AMBAM
MALPPELLTSLESCDGRDVEEIKQLVNESLANNKDASILSTLVECYLSSRSQRCLDVLVAIRESNAKYLFDKLQDCLKGKTRHSTLKLITNIVHRQPPWLHHITSHRILSHILAVIRNDTEPVHIVQASVIIFSLMPMLPVQFGTSALQETFEAFSALAALCTRKPSHVHESHVVYLKLSLQILFQYLYGMYPCNFLAFLRGYYGNQDYSRESLTVYTKTIRPLLQKTRVHPLLVTASKDAELSSARFVPVSAILCPLLRDEISRTESFLHRHLKQQSTWKKMQPYDILMECGHHTLDPKEHVTDDDEASSPPPVAASGSTATSPLPLLQPPKGSLAKGEPVIASSVLSAPCWSPVESCDLAPAWRTVGYSRSLSREKPYENTEAGLPLDLAVEATPEETGCVEKTTVESEVARSITSATKDDIPLRDLGNKAPLHSSDAACATEKPVPPAAAGGTSTVGSEMHFFSTTNNLTTEPHNSVSELPEYQEQQQLAHSMDRLRYFSQCPVRCCSSSRGRPSSRSTLERSRSCPRLQEPFVRPRHPAENSDQGNSVDACSPRRAFAAPTAESSLPPEQCVQEEVPQPKDVSAPEDPFSVLLPFSLPGRQQGAGDASCLALSDMSPSELLEKHLQLASSCYMQHALLAKKGEQLIGEGDDKLEEVECLKGQVCLLYAVLLYERHRRDIHMERNRRLLAKAKKILALEEETAAYKDQLYLLELEIENYKERLQKSSQEAKKEKSELEGTIKLLESKMTELHAKNEVLTRENRSMAEQVRHTESARAALQKVVDHNASDLMELDMELETARSRAAMSNSYRQQVESLQKELVALGEMYKRLEARLQASEPRPQVEAELAILQQAALNEVADIKHQLEAKQVQVESLSTRVKQLEAAVANRDGKVQDLMEQLKRTDAIHKEQLQCKVGRIEALTNLCQRLEMLLVDAHHCTDQRREPGSEASGGFDDVCAGMELDGSSPTVDPTGLLGSYTSNTEMTPVSDMLKEAEEALYSPERHHSPLLEELELSGTVQVSEEKPETSATCEKTDDMQ